MWHETLGTQEKRIEVTPAVTQKVDFTFTVIGGKEMNKLTSLILVGVLLGVTSPLLAADVPGVGIVKGTITLGGKAATNAVVSIENLSKRNNQITKPG